MMISMRAWALGAALVAATMSAYSPAIRGGFIWDDDEYVSENETLRDGDGLRRIWLEPGAVPQYYPLVHTTYWIEHRLWGLDPRGYHAVNVLLHAASAILLWRILRLLGASGAWVVAAVFALHPVHVESVAWITERKNVLSGALYLGAAWAWLRGGAGSDRKLYALSLFLFAGALCSKTVTATLPAALLLAGWWQTGQIVRRAALRLAPMFALGALGGTITVWMEKRHVGAEGAPWELSVLERCLVAGRALWFYAGKLLWPRDLAFIYPRWEIDAAAWWQYLFPAGAAAAIVLLWRQRARIGRGPLAAALFFAGTLLPALGFFDVYPMRYSFVADHFQYLASIGLLVAGVAAGHKLLRRVRPGDPRPAIAAAVAVLAVLGMLTWGQAHVYRDAETVWRDTLAKNPACWLAHNNLGKILNGRAEYDAAIASFEEALRYAPGYALAHNNLGVALARRNQFDEAIRHFRRATELAPGYVSPHFNLGSLYLELGDRDLAARHLNEALRLDPGFREARELLQGLGAR